MNNTLLHLQDYSGTPVRVYGTPDQPLFVAADVCRVLALSNPTESLRTLDEDEKITLSNPEGNPRAGIPHQTAALTESGLYHLIFKSRKPEAKAFRRWVTSEVLPAIRKTGEYQLKQPPITQSEPVKEMFALMQKLKQRGVSSDTAAQVASRLVIKMDPPASPILPPLAAEDRLYSVIKSAGAKGITKAELTRKTQRLRRASRNVALKKLQESGRIEIGQDRRTVKIFAL